MAYTGTIGHIEVDSPWLPAGGVLDDMHAFELMSRTGVGGLEKGSVTLEGRLGNAVVVDAAGVPVPGADALEVVDYDQNLGRMVNSRGMPGEGMDEVEQDIPEMRRIAHAVGKPLIFNVAPVTTDPATEALELTRRAYDKNVDAVLVNAGCPNVITADGGRKELLSRNHQMLSKVLMTLNNAGLPKPVFLRLSPYESIEDAFQMGAILRMYGKGVVSAVYTPNTWPVDIPTRDGKPVLDVEGTCGMSGPIVADAAQEQTAWMVGALRGSGIDVVRSSGITNGRELHRGLETGAVAGAGTTFFYQSANWKEDVNRLLEELAESYTEDE